ncbi:MAG: hypothetical protein C4570_05090 [Ammonifex sp.]|jgi:hypothetical protein|nr:MAG: hypothetical protein C4570_05090 [Ammonifex sp.]
MFKRVISIFTAALFAIFVAAGVLSPAVASIHPPCQWVQVDADNNPDTPPISVYGYWTDVGGHQVLIVCDPSTDEPVKDADRKGIAYVNQGQYVETEIEMLDRYEYKKIIDWDNPKEVKPLQVDLTMPNIATSTTYDWAHYRQTGELRRKTDNRFGWPMSYSFAQLAPGSNPDYWLMIATVKNPNPFAVSGSLNVNIYQWTTGWNSSRISKQNVTVSLGPNETKFVLVNRGKPTNYNWLANEMGYFWSSASWRQGYSTAWYYTSIGGITDPRYPAELGGGYYKPYVRWDGTNPTVYPLIPMRLAYTFYCWSYDPYKQNYYYGYYGGREWPHVQGDIEYDPNTDSWTVTNLHFLYMEKPWYMSDADWQKVMNAARSNAITTLTRLFKGWGFTEVPFWSAWNGDQIHVNGETGQNYGTSWPRNPPFTVTFKCLEPVSPSNVPRPPGSQYWWSNSRWGGWLYTTAGPTSYGTELPAPVLLDYSQVSREENCTAISYNGDVYVQIGRGTYISNYGTDPRYYDPDDWMRYLPVFKAEPMFVERYAFIPTQGDCGVLKKDVVPGYLLRVSVQQRPVVNTATRPVEINATCSYYDTNYIKTWHCIKKWKWTPGSGWELVSDYKSNEWNTGGDNSPNWPAQWNVTVNYTHAITASNPMECPVAWYKNYGAVDAYWPNAPSLSAQLVSLADTNKVNTINVDSIFNVSQNVLSLSAGETKLNDADNSAAINFWRSRRSGESTWNTALQNTLNEIVAKVVPQLCWQGEIAFVGNSWGPYFRINKSFETGQGGVVTGAQRYLIHRRYVWKSSWDSYGWDNYLNRETIGFKTRYGSYSPTDWGLYSYFGTSSPTGGMILTGNDELLGTFLNSGNQARTISLTPWEAATGATYWRYYYNGSVYPPNYPE